MSTTVATAKTPFVPKRSRLRIQGHPLVLWGVQLAAIALAGMLAFLLRFDFRVPGMYWPHVIWATAIWVVVKPAVFWALGIDRSSWRYISIPDVMRIGAANVVGSIVGAAGILVVSPPGFPRSVYFLDLLLCACATAGVRLGVRMANDMSLGVTGKHFKRILIYGAGSAGISLLREIRSNPKLGYVVCGLIDDDPSKVGSYIQQIRVKGAGPDIRSVTSKELIDEVLIAIPSATGSQMTGILQHCHDAGVRCKTIPGMAAIIEGAGLAGQIRDVAVEDLLVRTPVVLDESAIRRKIEGRVALVTGAAGSIGSELCRQIARFEPAAIIGYEIAETALFHLERELSRSFPTVRFAPEIGSIQNLHRLSEVFERHHPSIVFHAAAYKHVALMESHAFEAVENNVLGTLNVARVSAQSSVEDFVMISSDKAVYPTNIMGATKKIAELVVRSLQNSTTRFMSVRFGNVLGSSGSVIPIFKEQIARGGPVTVTDAEMRRFFMTIPEASQLVLQASTLGQGGEIFVLDMGEPIRIVDLARNLILLSGLHPGDDIQIEFIGSRPGEKLYEELHTSEEDVLPTRHEKIKVFAGTTVSWRILEWHMGQLNHACAQRDFSTLISQLRALVPEYNPSAELLHRAVADSGRTTMLAASNVVQFGKAQPPETWAEQQ